MTAPEITGEIRARRVSAVDIARQAMARIETEDGRYNAVTRVLHQRAMECAARIDRLLAAGQDPGPLAGVPFGIKDLFDVRGEVTTAGSRVLAGSSPATKDAILVSRLIEAGAVPVATTNMDEFAYGFATDNAHHGVTRNPHDQDRLAGGSSGGSAAGVAAGFFPVALGSDTNGSIRVPASLCGVWGLRATQGRLPTEGSYPFVASLDTVGPFATSSAYLRATFEALSRTTLPAIDTRDWRIARLGGWFATNMTTDMAQAMDSLARHLDATQVVELPEVARARAAAFVISAAEGGSLHLPRLRQFAGEYDPAVRDRLLAGALLPAHIVFKAQRLRNWFRRQMHKAFANADILIAPAVPCVAPRLDEPTIRIDGRDVPARANLGIYTQPLTLAGFPILTLPMRTSGLPLGAQLIARPGREDQLFALAAELEGSGMTTSPKKHDHAA